LGAAGTTSAITGTGAAMADSVGWLNANADGMGILIGCVMAVLTGAFYVASIYLRVRELRRRHDQVVFDLEKGLFAELIKIEGNEEAKEIATKVFKEAIEKVKR
jgi:hypothetical protein